MALSARQRNKLPPSAFVYRPTPRRSTWRYPVPTAAQASKAGISEAERQRIHTAALAYGTRSSTMGSITKIRAVVQARRRKR